MSINHKDLTGTDLHEPKGVDTATVGQVYVADGVGSGAWANPLSDVNNLNSVDVAGIIENVSDAGQNFMYVIPRTMSLTHLRATTDAALTAADDILSIYKNNVLQGQTLTLPYTTSGKGVVRTLTLSPTYSFVAGDTIEIRTDGGSGTAARCYLTMTFTV